MNEPFGRQPEPVRVLLTGDQQDVTYWKRELMRKAEFKGDLAQSTSPVSFTIYPRAVND